ncbi:23S rRNA (guanosine(2251)-2'-O)-methyltransferase RlmB [Desulfotalea psychrophila]|uniref:Related to tRNA/rRNA methyltransferase n=1 Tax=Desulfotalea psychrophila (strain LSv54 / DSM 12343) TaxID=177439 RepID=Q6AJ92_DESPS|nr:23S rRNA (guanosine(2251)-2'-O)-methyltransferase RlmB [Desulfotalea psychrophila]CAG37588.1 related to tRNA/rRNA methyltransferase [Desulfotalea psychrophila LSv54]
MKNKKTNQAGSGVQAKADRGAPRRDNKSAGQDKKAATQDRRIRFSEDLIWGIHPIVEALKYEPNRISEIIAQKDRRGAKFDEIVELARAAKVKVTFIDSISLQGDGAASARHQGVIAKVTQADLMDFADFLQKFKDAVDRGEKPRIIVCDSLQDPHNLGAIVRSALASGAIGVLLTRERSAPLGGTAAKSSAGAISHMDICQVTNLVKSLAELKKVGAWVFGAIKDADAVSLFDADLNVPACIVVGSEGTGIRPLVRRECDIQLSIPMVGELDSLNSSVAAAVILFEAMRQSLVS